MFNLNLVIMPKTSMLDHRANLSRSGFDMSQSLAFTASTGMILPLYSDFLNSGDSVHITTDLFARTQPLVTAAMADVDVYLDWFFVPMTMLFTPWGQIRWQTNDFISSMFLDGDVGTVSPPSNSGQGSAGFPLLSDASFAAPQGATLEQWNLRPVYSIAPQAAPADGAVATLLFPTNMNAKFESSYKSMFRMLDLLGYNPRGVFGNIGTSNTSNPDVFPWRALTYQCIYQNYFRNDDYEVRDVLSYNWDKYWNSPSAVDLGNSTTSINGRNPFIMRYADYRRDYFTSVRPSPIMSAINTLTNPFGTSANNSDTAFNILQKVNNFLGTTNMTVSLGSTSAQIIGGSTSISQNSSSGVNITQSLVTGSGTPTIAQTQNTSNLRSLFAVEKLMRITGRAAKDYDSQTLAHFGFKVPHDVKHQLTHLHSSHGTLHIGEVVSTSDTVSGSNGTALGEIAGKGYVSIHDDKRVKFTAPVDGAIMCTFRAIPRVRVGSGFDKQNSITDRLSLYIPEFDKLGAQPLFNYEFSVGAIGSSTQVGWQNRYEQYKRKYDRVTSVFMPTVQDSEQINQYSSWVLTYTPFGGDTTGAGTRVVGPITGAYLKCPPSALNNIMVIPYTGTISDIQRFNSNPAIEFYTDPFICDFRANVKKVSVMSPTGEPDMVSL